MRFSEAELRQIPFTAFSALPLPECNGFLAIRSPFLSCFSDLRLFATARTPCDGADSAAGREFGRCWTLLMDKLSGKPDPAGWRGEHPLGLAPTRKFAQTAAPMERHVNEITLGC